MAQEKITEIELYLHNNKLKANPDKTKLIVMAKPSLDKSIVTIRAHSEVIKPSNNLKILGIYLSPDRE